MRKDAGPQDKGKRRRSVGEPTLPILVAIPYVPAIEYTLKLLLSGAPPLFAQLLWSWRRWRMFEEFTPWIIMPAVTNQFVDEILGIGR
jgi:hypothetical protein